MNKYQFHIDSPKETDYKFGAYIPVEVLQPNGDWNDYLPEVEFQYRYGFEPSSCMSFSLLSCIEAYIFRKYGVRLNLADRFLAKVSGTKDGGNTMRSVADALRKVGVVPENFWPYTAEVNSFDKYYEDIPKDIMKIAEDFIEEWNFKYDFVPSDAKEITKALRSSPLVVSVPAWFERNGRHYRPEGFVDTHATLLFYESEGVFRRIFDTYNPHIKDLEWDLIPMQIMRIYVEKRGEKKHFSLIEWIKNQFNLIKFFHAK